MDKYVTATISGAAVRYNLALLREQIGDKVKLYPVVKADCYGHGLELLLDTIVEFADGLCVANPAMAMWLRRLGYNGNILTFFSACSYMGDKQKLFIAELISADITQTVVDAEEADTINKVALELGVEAKIHLKIDTGMGRSGCLRSDVTGIVDVINKSNGLRLTGVYSHFSSADEVEVSATEKQLSLFKETVARSDIGNDIMQHIANSVATIRFPAAHLDLVRPGLAVYGYHACAETEKLLPLRPCLRVTAPVIQIKDVAAGSSCGYGLTFTFDKDGRIGRVPVGYGDGYPRSLSNKAVVRVKNKYIPVRGIVSMDQLIIDLTGISDVAVGDEVEIISNDSSALNSVENIARMAGTIPYEITCCFGGKRVERVLSD